MLFLGKFFWDFQFKIYRDLQVKVSLTVLETVMHSNFHRSILVFPGVCSTPAPRSTVRRWWWMRPRRSWRRITTTGICLFFVLFIFCLFSSNFRPNTNKAEELVIRFLKLAEENVADKVLLEEISRSLLLLGRYKYCYDYEMKQWNRTKKVGGV